MGANDELTRTAERKAPLVGRYASKVDSKGRILLSRANRERLGEEFVFGRAYTGVLAAYPKDIWWGIEDFVEGAPVGLARDEYEREVFGDAEYGIAFDEQSRVVVPSRLREVTGVKVGTEVMVVGCRTRVEIWPLADLEKYDANPDAFNKARRERLERLYRELKAQ